MDCALQNKRKLKLCFSARLLQSFFLDDSLQFRCRAVTGVSAGSLWPPSMWLARLNHLCHSIIVFRWSVQRQMTCDQFNHNALSLSWEMEWYYFIRWKTDWECYPKSNVLRYYLVLWKKESIFWLASSQKQILTSRFMVNITKYIFFATEMNG